MFWCKFGGVRRPEDVGEDDDGVKGNDVDEDVDGGEENVGSNCSCG